MKSYRYNHNLSRIDSMVCDADQYIDKLNQDLYINGDSTNFHDVGVRLEKADKDLVSLYSISIEEIDIEE